MTDEQIVKALEQCASEEYCSGCSMLGRASVGYECMKKVMKDAADLINRQQAEIEDLKFPYKMQVEVSKELENKIKSEAVREFAEKLKETNLYEFIEEYFDNAELCYEVRSDLFNDFIDKLVMEMTEERK